MYIQTLVVAIIITAAVAYVANVVRLKVAATRMSKKNCGHDCGCGQK